MSIISRGIGPIERDTSWLGDWNMEVRAPRQRPVNISFFRNAPTTIQSFSHTDPFGPRDLRFFLPQVTLFDRLGEGDLAWLHPDGFANVDLVWTGSLPAIY